MQLFKMSNLMTKEKQQLHPLKECCLWYPFRNFACLELQTFFFFKFAKTLTAILGYIWPWTKIANLARTVNFKLWHIHPICFITIFLLKPLKCSSLPLSRLNYCNCLLSGCPQYLTAAVHLTEAATYHRHHDVSVAMAYHSTLHTPVTVFKRQPVTHLNYSWPKTSHLSFWPFPITAVIGSVAISMEMYILHWFIHGGMEIYTVFDFSLWTRHSSCHSWIGEFPAVCHFVISLCWLSSVLSLVATAPHIAWNRKSPISSTWGAYGRTAAK